MAVVDSRCVRTGVLICSILVVAWYARTAAAAPAQRPNIVLILADDLGWSDSGCYGGEIPTPHIDALAAHGLRFTQFYNNAVCGPSRASLLTGLYCQQVGHSGEHWNEPTDFSRCAMVSEVLQAAGYRTLIVGKWQERQLPTRLGYHHFFGMMCQSKVSYFNEVQLNPYYLDEARWTVPAEGFYLTDALTDYAVRFVEAATAQQGGTDGPPFFLYAAHIAPHWPLHALEADIALHRQRYRERGWDDWRQNRYARQRQLGLVDPNWGTPPRPEGIPPWSDEPDKSWQAERMAAYAAQVTALDRSVGRIVEAIRRAGVAENTLVLFLSDNGAAPDGGLVPTREGFGFAPGGENDTWRLDGVAIRPGSGPDTLPGRGDTFAAYGLAWASVSNTPFRSTKLTAYEGGIRTPLVVQWPAVIRSGGGITSHVGHIIDILPTFLEVAGAEYPASFDGRTPLPLEGQSFAPLFHGQTAAEHEVLCWNAPQNQAVRMGRWKLVNSQRGQPWELYDLETDGLERHNLADRYPERVRELADQWDAWWRRCGK